jgi:hypothetical protein
LLLKGYELAAATSVHFAEGAMRANRREQPERVAEASPDLVRTGETHRDEEPLLRRRALALVKRLNRSVLRVPRDRRRTVLIFGCQRSGTTMLQQTFLDRSWRILIVEEHDRRLVGARPPPGETDWQDYPTVLRRLRRIPFEVVAAKPLVESDRALELMNVADPVKAVWMLRHYGGVARSNLQRFGENNPYLDLQALCDHDSGDWRSRGASQETRETVIELMHEGLSPLDAAALFWWARNQLYFDQQLWRDERIRIIRYERACNCSQDVARALSDYIEIPLPPASIAAKVRPHSEAVSEVTDLKPEIERLCQKLWDSFTGCPEL